MLWATCDNLFRYKLTSRRNINLISLIDTPTLQLKERGNALFLNSSFVINNFYGFCSGYVCVRFRLQINFMLLCVSFRFCLSHASYLSNRHDIHSEFCLFGAYQFYVRGGGKKNEGKELEIISLRAYRRKHHFN